MCYCFRISYAIQRSYFEMTLEAELANFRFLNYSADNSVVNDGDNPLLLYFDNGKCLHPQSEQVPPFRQIQIIHMKQNDVPLPPLPATSSGDLENSSKSVRLVEDASDSAEAGNQVKFECNECGQKFDRLVMLTEHNCYEEDTFAKNSKRFQRVLVARYGASSSMSSQGRANYLANTHQSTSKYSKYHQTTSGSREKHSSNSASSRRMDSDMVKCPYCDCIFNESYFDKCHLQKCSEAAAKEDQGELIALERQKQKTCKRKKRHVTNQIRTGFGRRASELKQKRQQKISIANILGPMRTVVCKECGQIFETRKELNKHYCIYMDYKPFRCIVCGLIFSTKNGLYSHEGRMHSKGDGILRAMMKQETEDDIKNGMPLYELDFSVENFLRRRKQSFENLRCPQSRNM